MRCIACIVVLFLLPGCLPLVAGAGGVGYYMGRENREHRGKPEGHIIKDSHITYQVKNLIWGDPNISQQDISVETHAGMVTLSGTVDYPVYRERAELLARGAHGVVDVDNRLKIQGRAPMPAGQYQ